MMTVWSVLCHHHIREMNRLKAVLVALPIRLRCAFWLTAVRPARREPASTKPNTIESRCDASGQPSRVSPRLRVSASRTTVVAALPRTADRGSRAEDAAVGHARPAIAVATPDSPSQNEVCSRPIHSRQPAMSKAHKRGSHPIRSAENDEGATR